MKDVQASRINRDVVRFCRSDVAALQFRVVQRKFAALRAPQADLDPVEPDTLGQRHRLELGGLVKVPIRDADLDLGAAPKRL